MNLSCLEAIFFVKRHFYSPYQIQRDGTGGGIVVYYRMIFGMAKHLVTLSINIILLQEINSFLSSYKVKLATPLNSFLSSFHLIVSSLVST